MKIALYSLLSFCMFAGCEKSSTNEQTEKQAPKIEEKTDNSEGRPIENPPPTETPAPTTFSTQHFGMVTNCAQKIESIGTLFPPDWLLTNQCSPIFEAESKDKVIEKMKDWKDQNCKINIESSANFENEAYKCTFKPAQPVFFDNVIKKAVEGWSEYNSYREPCITFTLPEQSVICEKIVVP